MSQRAGAKGSPWVLKTPLPPRALDDLPRNNRMRAI
jgi:hypothetical protein